MIVTALVIAIGISLANAQNFQACADASQDPRLGECGADIVSIIM